MCAITSLRTALQPSSHHGTRGLFPPPRSLLHTIAEAEEAFSREVLVMRQNMMSRFLFISVVCSYMSVPHVLLSAIRVWDCVDIDPLREVPEYSGSGSLYESTLFYEQTSVSIVIAMSTQVARPTLRSCASCTP